MEGVQILARWLLILAALSVSLASIAGFFGRRWWVFDLFSHFRVQYLALLVVIGTLLLIFRQPKVAMLAAVFAAVNLATILPLNLPSPFAWGASPARAANPACRALLVNVLQPNRETSLVANLIEEANPDLVVLVEVNQRWMDELQPVLATYPYRVAEIREDHYGIALASRIPLETGKVERFDASGIPAVVARLTLEHQVVTLLGAHIPPPKSAVGANQRNRQLEAMARFAAVQPGPVIVIGDLNITSWSPYFRDFIFVSGLRDSRRGFGIQPTWSTNTPLLMVPIDHVLVSDGIRILERKTGPYIGSDHLPVTIDFSVQ